MRTIMALSMSMITLLVACNHKQENKNQEALAVYDEAMKVHDAVMPRMDEIYSLKKKLESRKDSLQADSAANATTLTEIATCLENLEKADKGMRNWMHNVQVVPGTTNEHHHAEHQQEESTPASEEEILKVQQDQKAAIEQVKKDMESSIDEAKVLLQKQ